MSHNKIKRTNKKNSCPVCHKHDGCGVTDDGLIICLRSHGEISGFRYLGEASNGMGGLYREIGDTRGERLCSKPSRQSTTKPANKKAEAKKSPQEIERYFEERRNRVTPEKRAEKITWYTKRLGLSDESSKEIGEEWEASEYIGYPVNGELVLRPKLDDPGYLLTRMRDGRGNTIGGARRDAEGNKWRLEGGREGLFYKVGAADQPGPIVKPEGPTCARAGIEMGLRIVARPSVNSGGEYFAEWLHANNISDDQPIIIPVENDRKSIEELPSLETENGFLRDDWPGRTGSERYAARLAELGVKNPIILAINPGGYKDLRDWYIATKNGIYTADLPPETLGKLYVAALTANRIVSLSVLESEPATTSRPARDVTEEELLAAALPPQPRRSESTRPQRLPRRAPDQRQPQHWCRQLMTGLFKPIVGDANDIALTHSCSKPSRCAACAAYDRDRRYGDYHYAVDHEMPGRQLYHWRTDSDRAWCAFRQQQRRAAKKSGEHVRRAEAFWDALDGSTIREVITPIPHPDAKPVSREEGARIVRRLCDDMHTRGARRTTVRCWGAWKQERPQPRFERLCRSIPDTAEIEEMLRLLGVPYEITLSARGTLYRRLRLHYQSETQRDAVREWFRERDRQRRKVSQSAEIPTECDTMERIRRLLSRFDDDFEPEPPRRWRQAG